MNQSLFCHEFYFVHKSGNLLYPVMIRNRDTQRVAFRVAKAGNTRDDSLEVNEAKMKRLVLQQNYAVRMSTLDGKRTGLYRATGTAITRVVQAESNAEKGMSATKRFNPSSPHPARAVQAWQILVGAVVRPHS
jgi:hypothetical protein